MCRGAAQIGPIGRGFLRIGYAVEQELHGLRAMAGFQFPVHVRKSVEKELTNVGLGESVAAVNPLPGHQFGRLPRKKLTLAGELKSSRGPRSSAKASSFLARSAC